MQTILAGAASNGEREMQAVAAMTGRTEPEEADPLPGRALAGHVTVTDAELVARAQAGDRDAFGELVRRWHEQMFRLAWREVQDEAEAVEIVQDVFVRAWQSIGTFRNDSKFSTWIYRITLNRCRDWFRARKRARTVSFNRGGREVDDAIQAADRTASLAAEPVEERLVRQFEVEAVRRAMRRLPEKQRRAITLKVFEGLTLQEIADVLNKPLSTVKTRVYQGLITLRRLLAEPARADRAEPSAPGAPLSHLRLATQRGGESDG